MKIFNWLTVAALIALIIISIILLLNGVSHAKTFRTPAGIHIFASASAVKQYQERWGKKWNDIEWNKVDALFFRLRATYGATWFKPNQLTIMIHAWTPGCNYIEGITHAFSYADSHYAGCVDGVYFFEDEMVAIHLGDDSGTGNSAFCATALGYELGHVFLRALGDGCWYWEFSESCPSHYLGGCE